AEGAEGESGADVRTVAVAHRLRVRPTRAVGADPYDGGVPNLEIDELTVLTPTDGPAGRLLLLDGHSLAYRAFFALPVENFSTTTGQPTNAVYGFTSMLINVLRDETPSHIAVAFDLSAPTFRHAAYPAYKATRNETPSDFRGQVSLTR